MLIFELFRPLDEQQELLCELKAIAPGVKIYDDPVVGTLTPDQIRHNLDMLKQGKAELDWKDHVGQQVQDASNILSWGVADKVAAYVDSLRHNTKYADELNKYRDITAAYSANDQAINLRKGVKAATGYQIDKDNPIGNLTPGDVAGLAAQAPIDAYLALKGAAGAKGKVGKFIRGAAAMSAPGYALGYVAEPDEAPPPPPPARPSRPVPGGVQEGMGFLGEKDVEEAANAAQRAAIAIAMKKAGKKPKTAGRRDTGR
jgi:hypothetical protein